MRLSKETLTEPFGTSWIPKLGSATQPTAPADHEPGWPTKIGSFALRALEWKRIPTVLRRNKLKQRRSVCPTQLPELTPMLHMLQVPHVKINNINMKHGQVKDGMVLVAKMLPKILTTFDSEA